MKNSIIQKIKLNMKNSINPPRMVAVFLSIFSALAWQDARAHDPVSSIYLSGENGRLVVRDSYGNTLDGNVWQGVFGTEREWDERAIYDHVNGDGTPVDASGRPAYTGVELPHLRSSGGAVKNPDYVTDDYAWREYPNSAALAVVPADDGVPAADGVPAKPGSVDNKPIRLEVLGGLLVWNGSAFVPTGGESLDLSVWSWTTVDEDGVADQYDAFRFPDGGWYGYPDGRVRLGGTPVLFAGYDFYPGDHYHWLLELSPDEQGQRESGVYALRVRFTTADNSLAPSESFGVLLAQGLGDWETATHTPGYMNAVANLSANPAALLPAAHIAYEGGYNLGYSAGYDRAVAHLAGNSTAAAALGLYTAASIQDLNLGGLVLDGTGGNATLRLQLQTTSDLSQAFQNTGAPVEIPVSLGGNKGFLRVRALGPQ